MKGERPILRGTANLKGAGGSPIRELGKASFRFVLGPLEIEEEAIVAEIEDEVLLGYDILGKNDIGPADILLSKNVIVLGGHEIPCIKKRRSQRNRKVVVADDVVIPGLSETVVGVYVERDEDDDRDLASSYIVEPTDDFSMRYKLMMASTLVDVNRGPTCKIRIMNPFDEAVDLRQSAEIAVAEKIGEVVTVVTEAEDEGNVSSGQAVRRLDVKARANSEDIEELEKNGRNQLPEHLKELHANSTAGKSDYQKRVVAGLLLKYKDSFSKDEWDLGLTNLAEHPINTGDAAPVRQRPRRVPLAYANEEKKAIEDLLKKGVIQKSTSNWSSPIVLVKKKSGAIRPCIDYRRVNALVKQDGFPLPRVQDCLDAVSGSAFFSSLDLTSGYFQIPLKKEDVPKSAFCCKFGHFEMTRMPFGLNNASSTFQRTMELALQGLQWEICLVYIDDIIVYAETFEEHMARVDEVLGRVKQAGLKLRPDKCHLLQPEVTFLGHVVSKDGVGPDPTNVAKILGWPRPETPKQVKQFVATASYYRRFVKNFAKSARPLVELTKKGKEFIWSEESQTAFELLKAALVSPEVMGYPLNEGGTFYLDVDASGTGIGGVLAQLQEGRERVISYASRALSKAERNYCITELELLAVVFFMQYFRQYLLGRKFVVRTDHQALIWLFSLKEPNGKIARWLEILASYDFIIEYRSGSKQSHCDGLSRCDNPRDCSCADVDTSEPLKCGPCSKCRRRADIMALQWNWQPIGPDVDEAGQESAVLQNPGGDVDTLEVETTNDVKQLASVTSATQSPTDKDSQRTVQDTVALQAVSDEEVPSTSTGCSSAKATRRRPWLSQVTAEQMSKLQMKDPHIGIVYEAKVNGIRPVAETMQSRSAESRHYWVIWEQLQIVDQVLYRDFSKADGTGHYMQLIVPINLRKDVIFQNHNPVTAGHLGVKRTKTAVSRAYYWYDMKSDIRLYVQSCPVCEADKKPPKRPRAPMGHIAAGAPWDVLALDFVGPFPITDRGNRYILVMTDHFTKYVEVLAVPNQSAEECARRLVDEVISRWGAPLSIHTDQGTSFQGRLFQELCRILEIKKTRTSARNPRGNGQVERFNRSLLKMIRAYIADEQSDWDLYLGCLAGAYRATPHESTSLTPNMMMLGREVRMPGDVMFGQVVVEKAENPAEYAMNLRSRIARAHDVARKHLGRQACRNKELYDSKLSFQEYRVGDVVWYLHEARKVGVNPKLERAFQGPFLIVRKQSPVNFTIQLNEDGQERLVHHNKLKVYRCEELPRWIIRKRAKLLKQKSN